MLAAEGWKEMFEAKLAADPFLPDGEAAMQCIQEYLHMDESTTLQELIEHVRRGRAALCSSKSTGPTVSTAAEMFTKYITRAPTAIENAKDLDEIRDILTTRGKDFIESLDKMPSIIAKRVVPTLLEFRRVTVLTQSWNPCVLQTCIEAHKTGHDIMVYVTEGYPQSYGKKMVKELKESGVRCELVPDTSVGFYIDRCTCVILGAEAVCRNVGVICKMGGASLAAAAVSRNRKVIVLAQTYRITTHSPLNNCNLLAELMLGDNSSGTPNIDYINPGDIARVHSDVGQVYPTEIMDLLDDLHT